MDSYRNDSSFAALALSFITGGVIGATLGLLFAPRTGEETREIIREQAECARQKLRGKAQIACERVSEAEGKIQESVERLKETVHHPNEKQSF